MAASSFAIHAGKRRTSIATTSACASGCTEGEISRPAIVGSVVLTVGFATRSAESEELYSSSAERGQPVSQQILRVQNHRKLTHDDRFNCNLAHKRFHAV